MVRGPVPGKLSIVATPIGNLEDITLRALRTLREASLVLAEDTRRSRKLLNHHGIATQLRSFHAYSSQALVEALCARMEQGEHFALVSDAGTPLVSDPGAELASEARKRGIQVEAIPGASAPLAALCSVGFVTSRFRFVGFLPRSGKRRREFLTHIAADLDAVVLFEAPSRLHATLDDLSEALGERPIAVCRELTKMHEEVARGTAKELAARFETARGEITIVISPRAPDEPPEPPDEDTLRSQARAFLDEGLHAKDIAANFVAQYGLVKRDAYQMVLSVKDEEDAKDAEDA